MKKSDIIIILLILILLVLIFIVAPARAFTSMHRGDVNITGLLNDTEQGKIYLNASNGISYNGTIKLLTDSRIGIGTAEPQKAIHIRVNKGHDEGITITNDGTGYGNESTIRLENPFGYATLFTTTNTGPGSIQSRTGFFTSLANGFTITNGNSPNFQFNITGRNKFGIGIGSPLHDIHVLATSPVTFAGQVDSDSGAIYTEFIGKWSGGDAVGGTRIERDGTNSVWRLYLMASNFGTMTSFLTAIGTKRVYINTTTGLYAHAITGSFALLNGTNFNTIYGRTNQTLAKNVLLNNTRKGKVYINNTLFVNSTSRYKQHTIMERLAGTYVGGSAYVCVYDNGTLYTNEAVC